MEAGSVALTAEQRQGLLDILTHYETYQELAWFKRPEAVTKWGYPFSRSSKGEADGSESAATRPTDTGIGTPRGGPKVAGNSGETASSSASWLSSMFGSAKTSQDADGPCSDDDTDTDTDTDKDKDGSQEPSQVPVLQTLLRIFPLGLPGLRNLPRAFWSDRMQGLLTRLGDADFSESYDKGALGTRKTLATGASSLLEMLARGVLEGVSRDEGATEGATQEAGDAASYDCTRADDVTRAWQDCINGLVYGHLVDGLFDHLGRTEHVEGHSPAVKAGVDYAIVHMAAFAHRVFVGSAEGQYMLKLVENVHGLMPYRLIRQTLRIGNAATMINGLVRLMLAKLSVGSLTNWVGLTQGADDGMNLLQRIISLVLSWDASDFSKSAERAEKRLQALGGSKASHVLERLRHHVAASREAHEAARQQSLQQGVSILVAILGRDAVAREMSAEQHALYLEYYSALLSVRDREAMTAVLCRQTPDLFTRAVRDAVAAYEPMIRSVHARVDLKEHLDALEGFIDDFIHTSKTTLSTSDKSSTGTQRPGVEAYVKLLRRNRHLFYRWLHALASQCPDISTDLRHWAKQAVSRFQHKAELASKLDGLVGSLSLEERDAVLAMVDAHAEYLAELRRLSHSRLQLLLEGGSGSQGPGVYLVRWQDLLDETEVTPAEKEGRVRTGREVRGVMTMGKGEAREEGREEREEREGPEVKRVVDVLGQEFWSEALKHV
ncbi:hypothetical protein CDD82_3389 [Ophiocordyceps australis]|uniref:Uncharacterized protein n=1 Tax=Ophiocordyceps australis TaxID=1399860 RepID=A0A2C5XPT0_9HYPO|nr:hypothetical protein CDD82_3389 [Ophiocordyceps australis]